MNREQLIMELILSDQFHVKIDMEELKSLTTERLKEFHDFFITNIKDSITYKNSTWHKMKIDVNQKNYDNYKET